MPELPEVETICRSLRDHVVGRTMAEVEIQLSRLIKWPTPEDFRSIMTGRTIEALERRGKYLLFQLSGDWVLVVPLRMTGRLYYRAADAAATGSPRVVFHFAGGDALEYYDTRTLGTLYLLRQNELSRIYGLSSLGPEPLTAEFTPEYLSTGLARRMSARSVARLTDTLSTPGTLARAASTRPTQLAQVMPSMGRLIAAAVARASLVIGMLMVVSHS